MRIVIGEDSVLVRAGAVRLLEDAGSEVLGQFQYVEEDYVMRLMAHGTEGVGYLLKDRIADVERLLDAVARVAEGGSVLDPEVVAHMLGRRRPTGPLDRLTPRET